MAAVLTNEKWTTQIVWKRSYDTEGFYNQDDWSKTVNTVKESATLDQIFAANEALMKLTTMAAAPYIQYLTKKGEMTVE